MKKKKKIRMHFKGFTRDDIELLEHASKREPPKYRKQSLYVFKCYDCEKLHYYKVSKCVLCGCSKMKIIGSTENL